MICQQLEQRLLQGKPMNVTEPDVARHLANCPQCAALLGWLQEADETPPHAAPVLAAQSSILRDLRAVRPMPTGMFLFGGMLLVFLLTMMAFPLLQGSAGWHVLSSWGQVMFVAFVGLCFAGLVSNLLRMVRPGAPKPFLSPLALVLFLLVGYPVFILSAVPLNPAMHKVEQGLYCLSGGMMATLCSAPCVTYLVRLGFPLEHSWTGAMVGGFTGLMAVAGLQIFCPHNEASHMLLWRGLTLVISLVGGFWLGKRALRDE